MGNLVREKRLRCVERIRATTVLDFIAYNRAVTDTFGSLLSVSIIYGIEIV